MLRMFAAFFLVTITVPFVAAQSPATADPCAETKAQLTEMENLLKDWPDLRRYHDANSKVAAPARDEQRVVFMGDSITDSWDDPKYGGFFPGKPYIDRGISGQTTPQMLIRFRAEVIALKPKVVVILAGTNDIAGNTGPMSLEAIEDNHHSTLESRLVKSSRLLRESVMLSRRLLTQEGSQARSRGAVGAC